MTLGNEAFTQKRDKVKIIRTVLEVIIILLLVYVAVTNLWRYLILVWTGLAIIP